MMVIIILIIIPIFSRYITEAPDQIDCIHNMKVESIRICFGTFYLKVIPAVKFKEVIFQRRVYELFS